MPAPTLVALGVHPMTDVGAIRFDRAPLARAPLTVLCAVEPALASFDAARQAAALAAGGELTLVAPALPGDRSASSHLAAARFTAERAGVAPAELRLAGDDPVAALLAAAEAHDALVVVDRRDDGSPGRLADLAVRHAACPVLVARRLPHGRSLDDHIAVVAGTSAAARAGRALARRLAARPGAHVAELPAPGRATGGDDLLGAARRAGATLLVMTDADRALAARVARRAPCPVLVMRTAARADAPPAVLAPVAGVVSRPRSRAALRGFPQRSAALRADGTTGRRP